MRFLALFLLAILSLPTYAQLQSSNKYIEEGRSQALKMPAVTYTTNMHPKYPKVYQVTFRNPLRYDLVCAVETNTGKFFMVKIPAQESSNKLDIMGLKTIFRYNCRPLL